MFNDRSRRRILISLREQRIKNNHKGDDRYEGNKDDGQANQNPP